MQRWLIVFVSSLALWLPGLPVYAQNVPGDCMASFRVKQEKVTIGIAWTLGAGRSAALSCGAGELLRERHFVEGDKILSEGDLKGSPQEAKQKAMSAYNDLEEQIQNLPGEDVNGTLFAAGGYLVSKYLLASCLLTAEGVGGTCWAAAASFVAKTFRVFQKVYQDDKNKVKKQELLATLRDVKPALDAVKPGRGDQASARARWVQTQTNLCRAVQRDCL